MKIGFLIIDMQKIFLDNKNEIKGIDNACEYINYISKLLREQNHCIVHVKDIEDNSDEELLNFIPQITIKKTDYIVNKVKSNAFWNTELEAILKKEAADLIIISGFSAENCVIFTFNGAIERNFKTVILQNGILSSNKNTILETYRDRNVISYPAIEFLTNIKR